MHTCCGAALLRNGRITAAAARGPGCHCRTQARGGDDQQMPKEPLSTGVSAPQLCSPSRQAFPTRVHLQCKTRALPICWSCDLSASVVWRVPRTSRSELDAAPLAASRSMHRRGTRRRVAAVVEPSRGPSPHWSGHVAGARVDRSRGIAWALQATRWCRHAAQEEVVGAHVARAGAEELAHSLAGPTPPLALTAEQVQAVVLRSNARQPCLACRNALLGYHWPHATVQWYTPASWARRRRRIDLGEATTGTRTHEARGTAPWYRTRSRRAREVETAHHASQMDDLAFLDGAGALRCRC